MFIVIVYHHPRGRAWDRRQHNTLSPPLISLFTESSARCNGLTPDHGRIGKSSQPLNMVHRTTSFRIPNGGRHARCPSQKLTDGRYNMRHTSQLIIPGLYLGPLQTALNSEKMQELGITHMYVHFIRLLYGWPDDRLCVRDKREKAVVYERYPETYQYYVVEVSEHLVSTHLV